MSRSSRAVSPPGNVFFFNNEMASGLCAVSCLWDDVARGTSALGARGVRASRTPPDGDRGVIADRCACVAPAPRLCLLYVVFLVRKSSYRFTAVLALLPPRARSAACASACPCSAIATEINRAGYTPNPITVTHARTVRWDVLRCPSTPVSPATLSACFIAFVISGLAVARRHVTARGTRDGARQAHLRAAPTELAEQQVAHPLQRLLRA